MAQERRLGWCAALVYALCTLSLAHPALRGGFLVNLHSDQYIGGYAFREFAAQSLRAGHGFPQWNPFFFGGMPYIAAMHGDIFYPTFLLRMVLPTDVAMTWGFIIHLFFAGLFTYFFLRAWGLGFYPALLGGVAYMLTGVVASYASPGHDGKLFVSALTPLALWQLVRGVRDGRAWAWGAFAITVGLAVLSPHPQLLQYMLLVSGAFALYVAFSTRPDGTRLPRDVAVRRVAWALGAVVLGALIGAVQYLPVREYVPWSPRAGGMSYAFATSYSFPIEELVNTYLPRFTGILDHYWGRNGIHLHSEYLGVVVLFLAPLAFGARSRKSFARFWLGVVVVSLLWALGGNTPFFHLVYAVVPGTKFFRAPSTIYYLTAFAMSVLAALGLERLLAGRVTRRYAIGWLVGAGVVALLASTGALSNAATVVAGRAAAAWLRQLGVDPSQVPQEVAQLADRARANDGALLLDAWRSFLFVAVVACVVLAWLRGMVKPRFVAWALVIAAAADLWTIDRHYWMFMPPASQVYASDPAIAYLERQSQPGRVLVVARSDTNVVPSDPYYGTNGFGKGSGFMVHGIRTVTGYHSNELGRYQVLGGEGATQSYRNTLSPVFWRHENVRWLYTNEPLPDTAFRLLAGPVRNSAGSTAYLYELPGDHPYAWVTAASVEVPDSIALGAAVDARFDPRRVAVFDTSAHVGAARLAALPEPPAVRATVRSFGAGRASISLDAPAPAGAALVVAENYYPGWHALVDGKPVRVARADYNLIGIPLPVGARDVELRFTDAAFERGAIVTVISLVAALLLVLAGSILDRRARTAGSSAVRGAEASP